MRIFWWAFGPFFISMDLKTLESCIEDVLESLGFELVDLERSSRGRLIRVFMDDINHQKSVNTDDCARVSNQLSRVLVVENVDFDRLEISSPGLDRVVKKLDDFARFAGKPIQIKLKEALADFENRRHFQGELKGVDNGKVVLMQDGVVVLLDPANIEKARLVPVISFSGD